MATSNFYEDGNNGLNVIVTEDEDETIVEDTLQNIVDTINSMGYSVDNVRNWVDTPRSFDTGQQFAIYNKNSRIVALLELCAGYYSGANVNIYTGQDLIDISDDGYDYDKEVTKNKRDIARVVKAVQDFTEGFRRTAQFSNGESIYERA
jgi:hypothetical protein